jgi:glycosyltransferase involved in cell wall biosynthesis
VTTLPAAAATAPGKSGAGSASPATVELSVLMPCLDEAETLATCIRKARGSLQRLGVDGEVVVADNGSVDGSVGIARREGARVVSVAERGYGAALRAGIETARGRYVIMADADDSYALDELAPFLSPLWVIGNAAYDDQLFVRQAGYLADGNWLGPFDQFTLAKGPAYPVFLAVVRRLGLPTALAFHVLALAAAGTLAGLIARLIGSRYGAAVAFTGLALNPVLFGPQASRLARDNVYAATSLLVFAVVGLVVVSATRPIRQGRRRSAAGTLALAIIAGALLAGYWLLREEWSWLLPALTVLIVGLAVAGRRIDSRGVRRVGARRLAQSRLLAGAAAVIVTGAVFGRLPPRSANATTSTTV